MQFEKKQSKGRFSFKDNLLLVVGILIIVLVLLLLGFLLNLKYKPHAELKKTSLLYYDNIFTSDQKFTFIPQKKHSEEFKLFFYYYSNGFLEKARNQLEKILKNSRDKKVLFSAYNNLANLSDILNRHKQALNFYKQALKLTKKNGYLFFNYAVSLYTHNQTKKSLKYFLQADKLIKHFYKNDLILGNLYYEKKDYKNALLYYKKISHKSKFYRQAQYNKALLYYSLNRKSTTEKSKKIFLSLINQPDSVAYLSALFLGNEGYRSDQIPQADEYYKLAITMNTQNYIAYYNLGILKRSEKKYTKAIEYFKKALVHYQNFDIYKNLGDLFYLNQNSKEGIFYLNKTSHFSNNNEISSLLADLYYHEKKYPEAFELYTKIIHTGDPSEKKVAYMNSGNILFLLKNYFRAIEYYKQALILDSQDNKIYYNIGMVYYTLKNYPEAIQNFEKSLSINPNNDKAKLQILLSYKALNKIEKAISKCKEIISEDNNPLFQYFLSILLFDAKNINESQTLLESLLTENIPYLDNVYFLLGVIYNENHQYNKAIDAYNSALQENSNFISALFNKALSVYATGNYKNCIALFTKYLTLTDAPYNKGQAYFNIANSYFRLKKYKISYEYYQRALDFIPDSNEIIFNRDLVKKIIREENL